VIKVPHIEQLLGRPWHKSCRSFFGHYPEPCREDRSTGLANGRAYEVWRVTVAWLSYRFIVSI
jgi:hypothetical protein